MIETQERLEFEPWQEDIINYYFENNANKLCKLVYPMLVPVGGIYQMDYDYFLEKAMDVLFELLKTYSETEGIPFHNYFKKCLRKRFITYCIRDKNRLKRKNHITEKDEDGKNIEVFVNDISIDTLVGDGDMTIGDLIPDSQTVEDIFIEKEKEYSDNMKMYLACLSTVSRKILELISIGYTASEIIRELDIGNNQYLESLTAIRSYRNTSILIRKETKKV